MATSHWILQGKGGVGKSFIASAIFQFLLQKGIAVGAIDTDPVNHTLVGYKEFNATAFNIMVDNNVDARKFDSIIDSILDAAPDQHLIIDNGASSFIPLLSYLKENNAFDILLDNGHTVFLHTVITAGQAMLDTFSGLKSLCDNFQGVSIVLWVNLFWGEIKQNGLYFEDFAIYQEIKNKIYSIINIPNLNPSTFGKDVSELLSRKQTFESAINSSLPIMERQRLATFWKKLIAAIEQGNLIRPEMETA
jgi:hypothetical protein